MSHRTGCQEPRLWSCPSKWLRTLAHRITPIIQPSFSATCVVLLPSHDHHKALGSGRRPAFLVGILASDAQSFLCL